MFGEITLGSSSFVPWAAMKEKQFMYLKEFSLMVPLMHKTSLEKAK